MNILLDANQFPSAERSIRARWAPVLLAPISGSCERLVVGVAAVNEQGFHLELANELERLRCLYGDEAVGVTHAVTLAGKYLHGDLARRSVDALTKPDPAVSGISIGECREAEGLSLQELAQSWMAALSSLYTQHETHVADAINRKLASETSDASPGGDRLPFLVCDFVKSQREGFGAYFSADLRAGKRRRMKGGSHQVVVDFAGPKLVANFSTLKARALTSSVHMIKRRLWDLKVERDKDSTTRLTRAHEMILQRPSEDDPQITEQQLANLSEALEALEAQADQEELRLVACSTVQEIGQRVLRYETAA